jgi:hypothetical protein
MYWRYLVLEFSPKIHNSLKVFWKDPYKQFGCSNNAHWCSHLWNTLRAQRLRLNPGNPRGVLWTKWHSAGFSHSILFGHTSYNSTGAPFCLVSFRVAIFCHLWSKYHGTQSHPNEGIIIEKNSLSYTAGFKTIQNSIAYLPASLNFRHLQIYVWYETFINIDLGIQKLRRGGGYT